MQGEREGEKEKVMHKHSELDEGKICLYSKLEKTIVNEFFSLNTVKNKYLNLTDFMTKFNKMKYASQVFLFSFRTF